MWSDHTMRTASGETLAFSESHVDGARATVLMFAGFTSRRLNATNTQLAARLEPFAVRSVACDLSGHGDSTGSIEDQTVLRAADQIGELIKHATRKYAISADRPLAIVGNSFSANAAIIAAARSSAVSALALKSPVTDYVAMRTALVGTTGMKEWKSAGVTTLPNGIRSSYKFIEDAASIDTYEQIANLEIPVLAIQGSDDEEIPESSRMKLEQVIAESGQYYVLVRGGNHNLSDPHFGPTIEAIGSFLVEHLHLSR